MNVTFQHPSKREIEELFELGLFAAQEQILTDCNNYAREDQGLLKDSESAKRNGMELEVSWNTPYAKRVYYTGKPSHDKNPNASLQWAEVAANNPSKEWAQIIEKAMNQ